MATGFCLSISPPHSLLQIFGNTTKALGNRMLLKQGHPGCESEVPTNSSALELRKLRRCLAPGCPSDWLLDVKRYSGERLWQDQVRIYIYIYIYNA